MFYCNPVSTKFNSNFNDLFNNTIIQATTTPPTTNSTSTPSPSSSSSSTSSTPLNSNSPLSKEYQNKLQKLDFNNINVPIHNNNNNNNNNKLIMSSIYNYQSNRDTSSSSSSSSSKRKITDFDDENIPSKVATVSANTSNNSSNHSNSNNYQIISSKPIDTKYINQKCALNIYYKVDLSTAIDEHFKKSFNIKNKNKIFQLGKSSHKSSSSESQMSKNFKHHANNYWNGNESLKSNGSPIQAAASSYDMYSWPYYSYNTPTTPSNPHHHHHAANSTNANTNHVHDSWNRAAVDMAASLYTNSHYASSLTNIHHHHHHQYNSLLTNNIFNESTTNHQNNTGSHHHLYNQQTTADLLSTLTNTRNNDLLAQKYSKNSQESSNHATATVPTNTFLVPTNAYSFSSSLNNSNQQQHQLQSPETSSQQSSESYNHLTDTSNTSYPTPYTPCTNDTSFIDYTASSPSTSNSSSSTVAKVAAAAAAAAAANQYLNASLNAAASTNSAQNNPSYQRYHHPQYLNHLELTKSSIQDCRRANNHYAHLSTHLPYPGFDLTAAAVDAAFKDSNSTGNTYTAPLWY